MWEEKGWWGPNAYRPNDSSFANNAGLAIQGLQNAAGVAGGHVKRYGLKLFNELTTEPERKKHLLEQSAESLMGVAGAGTLDIASEVALANIHRLPEKLRTPAVIGSLLIGSLDGGVPRLRGGNLQRINDLTQAANVSTEFRSASIPDRKTNPKKAQTAATVKSLGNIPGHTNGDVNGHTNGDVNGIKKGNPSTKVTEEEQLFDILNKSVDTYNVKLDQISAQLENLKPTPQNKPIISELNAQKREYNRLASTLQTLFPDLASKSDLKLGDDLSNALSKGGDLFFDDAGKALTNHFDRNSAPQRVTGWNLDVHHMAWLRALVAGIERGKVPTGIRNEAVKRLAIDYEKLVSNNPMNLVGIHGTPTHVAAHGGNVNANYSTKGRDILRRLQTLGPNPTAEQLAAEMNKVVDTMWGMAEEAVLSKPHQKLAFEKFEASNLSPSKKQYYIDEGLNPADTRHPLIPELDKDIKSTESQVSEYSKWLESLTVK